MIGEVAKAASNYLQLLSIIMRQIMEKLDLELIGRNYFDPYSASLIREYCIEIWPGYITSIRYTSILLGYIIVSGILVDLDLT